MRMSSSLIAPSAVVILSTALLCGLSDTAVSQTATGSATPLPSITVVAPKQVARPYRPQQAARPQRSRQAARPQRPQQVASTVASRPRPTTQTPSPAQGPVLAKLAALEKTSSNCTDGCQTSFKRGNQPWNGCSTTGGTFSATCRNVRNYKTYSDCTQDGYLLGWRSNEISWYCTSLTAGGKFSGEKYQVAELKRSGH